MNGLLRGAAGGFMMFAASAYLLFALPSILIQAGIGQAAAYTMTAATMAGGTLIMGLLARRAIVVGPSLPLVAFVIAVPMGGFGLSFAGALAAAMAAGGVMLLLSLAGLRDRVVGALPVELTAGVTAGIGLLLVRDGLQRVGFLLDGGAGYSLGPLDEPRLWLSLAAVLVMLALLVRGWQIFLPAVLVAALGIGLALGFTNLVLSGHVFLAAPPPLGDLYLGVDIAVLGSLNGAMAAGAIFLFMALESGAVLNARRLSGEAARGKAPVADSLAMSLAPLIGSPGAVALPHSAAGWLVGGDERMAAVVAAVLFGLCLFSLPVAGQFQDYATAPALIAAGLLLCTGLREIDFSDSGAIAATFVAAILPAVTGSIAAGFAVGAIGLIVIRLMTLNFAKTSPSLIVTSLLGVAWLAY
ncbi:MAG: solute carrier family 23 protein [Rhodospirillales bacterium]